MTHDEAHLLLARPSPLVRISSSGGRGMHSRHWYPGRLVGVNRTTATVVPFGHRREERIALRHIKAWRSRVGAV